MAEEKEKDGKEQKPEEKPKEPVIVVDLKKDEYLIESYKGEKDKMLKGSKKTEEDKDKSLND